MQHDIRMPSSSRSRDLPSKLLSHYWKVFSSLQLQEALPGTMSASLARESGRLHLFTFPPSLLDLVHQTHPNTVADCLLWPPPLLCHCLQWITQFFSLQPFSPVMLLSQLPTQWKPEQPAIEANMPAKQVDSLQIFISPLSSYLISQSHLALYNKFSPHFLTLFLKD